MAATRSALLSRPGAARRLLLAADACCGLLLAPVGCPPQVGAHHLVSGDPVKPDADHSEGTIAGIGLAAEQEDVLAVIGGE